MAPSPLRVVGSLAPLLGGVILRLCVWKLITEYPQMFSSARVVFETPLTSWSRALEGVHLYTLGIDPYESGTVHTPPLVLLLYQILNNLDKHTSQLTSILFFIICDVCAACALKQATRRLLTAFSRTEPTPTPLTAPTPVGQPAPTPGDIDPVYDGSVESMYSISNTVSAIYLLNPLTILTCAFRSSLVIEHVILAVMLSAHLGWSIFLVPLLTYLSVHNVYYILPLTAGLWYRMSTESCGTRVVCHVICMLVLCTSALALVLPSYTIMGSWYFINSVYGCMFSVCDLTPNMGLYWYFFMEMFDHFHQFFVYVLQLSPAIFLIPLGCKLSHKPDLLFYIVTMCIVIFKTYPSFGDISVYCALLPIFTHLFRFMRTTLFTVISGMVAGVMAPLMWRIWLVTFNPNFFYAISLVWNLAQIFLMNDILFGFTRRQHALLYGANPTDSKGKPLLVTLK